MFKRMGGGSKAFWTMLKKTTLFLHDGFPEGGRTKTENWGRIKNDHKPANRLTAMVLNILACLKRRCCTFQRCHRPPPHPGWDLEDGLVISPSQVTFSSVPMSNMLLGRNLSSCSAQPPFQVWNRLHDLLTYNLIVIIWLPIIFALKILFLSSSLGPTAFSLLFVNCTTTSSRRLNLAKWSVYVFYMIWHKGFQNCTFCCY